MGVRTDLQTLIALAMSRRDGNRSFAELGTVSEAVATRVKNQTGIDVSGFVFGIDESAVRHILKGHGDAQFEASRGQVAVTALDLENLPSLMENPDSVEAGGVLPDGTDTVIFKKTLSDQVIYVQEIRVGRKKLAAKTMWKVRLMPPATVKFTGLVHTSETSQTQPTTLNKILPKE
jgi:hypothetical protein